jgi:voltage-gated potassium channel
MSFRERIRQVIFGVDTRAGRAFDAALLVCILVSVLVVMLESVAGVRDRHEAALRAAGWVFTALFTVEYVLRLWSAERRLEYARSFFGIVDFLAVGPAWAALFTPVGVPIVVVRVLRLLRIFRVFGMGAYVEETRVLLAALRSSARRILVFLLLVMTIVVLLGSLMYVVEGPDSGFTSIPLSVYWAIVTLTTVGYGDISPQTGAGQAIAAVIMILGYSLIVVPTGFVSVAVAGAAAASPGSARDVRSCPACAAAGHQADARFCRRCGSPLD